MLKVFEGDALETVVWLATAYGLRRSEVCGLRWEAVDFEQGTIQICHTAVVNNGKVISDEQNRQKEQPANKANGNRKSLGHLKGAKTIAR